MTMRALVALAALACAPAMARGPAERVEIVVLGTTDVHGRLLPYDYYRNSELDHGLARVATLVDSIRAAEPNVVLLDSGDLLQGNPLTYVFGVVDPAETHPVILAMNRMDYDAGAIGNHEFNYGVPALERALGDADFPFLAGNVFVAGTDSLAFPAWTLVERDGVRIAVLGFTTPGSAVWDRHHVEGRLDFRDVVASARRVWPEAEAASDVQVVVIHSGAGPGSSYDEAATGVPMENASHALAEALPGIDLLLLGHSHREVPADTVAGVLVAQANYHARSLALARISLERQGDGWRIVERRSEVVPTKDVTPQAAFVEAIRPYHERTLTYVAEHVSSTSDTWSSARARLVDTPIIDLVQRVQLEATGADLSATPAFSTDVRIEPGPITRGHAGALYPYENTLRSIRITGKQLRDYLEHSARYFHRTNGAGQPVDAGTDTDLFVDSVPGYNYDMVEGVDYAIDVSRPIGDRIVELTYQAAPVRDEQTFTMALNSYRQSGGGGYSMLHDAPLVYDGNDDLRQLIGDWMARRDTVRAAEVFRSSWRLLPEAAVHASEAAAPATLVIAAALPPALPATSDSVRVAFLSTNDFHGALLPATPSWARGDTVGGAAVLAAYVRGVESRYPGATLHLDGGDVMQGTLISNLTYGRSSVETMNAIGLDAAAIGNHEFDWSVDTLVARMADADFQWLSANIFEKETGARPAWARPYAWIDAAGLRIAVIGASTVSTPQTTMPANVEPYEFRDIADVVNELAPGLAAEGADLIVLAVHAGAIADSMDVYHGEIVDAAERITAPLDLIVSGHTHSYVETVVNGIPIVQSRSSGTALGVVVLTYDRKSGEVVDHASEVMTTYSRDVKPDSSLAALVERHRAAVHEIASRPITNLAHSIERGARGDEWAMGDLVADAQRGATQSQIAMVNAGGIRTELPAGPVSYADVFAVQPFQNTLVVVELTGEQVKELLEAAVEDRIGQVSGVRFSFDPTRPYGERVREATLEDTGAPLIVDGDPVDPEAVYTVTVNNFMASGGDEYAVLKDALSTEFTGMIDSDVLADYLTEALPPVDYQLQNRITRLAPWPEAQE